MVDLSLNFRMYKYHGLKRARRNENTCMVLLEFCEVLCLESLIVFAVFSHLAPNPNDTEKVRCDI